MSLRISDGHLKFLPLYTVFVYLFEFEHQENLSLIIMSLATKPEAFQVQEQPKVIPFIDQEKGGRAGHSFLKEDRHYRFFFLSGLSWDMIMKSC